MTNAKTTTPTQQLLAIECDSGWNARETAQLVSLTRPDLTGVAEVLQEDPNLTASDVIELLDEATEEWAEERAHQAGQGADS